MRFTDEEILQKAREFGLRPCPVEWIEAPAHIVYDVASRGLPGRFSHWSFGKAFWSMKAQYDAGLSRIYELVLPTKPSLAFLLDGNTAVQTLLVKAHVLGHADFSNNNRFFTGVPENAHELAIARAERIRRYESRYGRDRVEALLTAALTAADHVEPEPYIGWREVDDGPNETTDEFADLRRMGQARPEPRPAQTRKEWTLTHDILQVIVNEARDLEPWERDIVSIVREDSLCFWPIRRTKIMNEGWASYWHQIILRELPLNDQEAMEFAQLHAGVCGSQGTQLNPYHLGMVIWRDIEQKHGREAMFELRATESDVSFLRNWLTKDVVTEEGLYAWQPKGHEIVATAGVDTWELVRDAIANEVAMGLPQIEVVGIGPDGELLLANRSGRRLDTGEAKAVLAALKTLWRQPIKLHDGNGQGEALMA